MSREKKARKAARKRLDRRRKCDPCAHKETTILLCHQRRPRLPPRTGNPGLAPLASPRVEERCRKATERDRPTKAFPAHGESRFRTACLSPRRGEVSQSDGEGPPGKSLLLARGKGVLAPPGADKARAPFPQRSKNAKESVSLQHFSGTARWIGGAKRRMRSPRSPVSATPSPSGGRCPSAHTGADEGEARIITGGWKSRDAEALHFSPSPVASRHSPPLGEEQAGCSAQFSCRGPAAGSPVGLLASPSVEVVPGFLQPGTGRGIILRRQSRRRIPPRRSLAPSLRELSSGVSRPAG